MKARFALGAAALAAGLLAVLSQDDEEEIEGEVDSISPRVGFRPAPAFIDISKYEDESPMCGAFYQARRGNIWLGNGPQSITWQALFRIGVEAGLSDFDARRIANSVSLKRQLANLIASSLWNDDNYGTWGYGPKDFVAEHGRAIPLAAVHADNRERLAAQQAPERVIERGDSSWKGTGRAVGCTGASRPYFWIPQISPRRVVEEGIATTEGMVWPGDLRLSAIEPPPEIWAIGGSYG